MGTVVHRARPSGWPRYNPTSRYGWPGRSLYGRGMRRACFFSVVALGGCAGSPPEPTRSRDPDAGLRQSEREAAAVGARSETRGSDAPLDGAPSDTTSASGEGGGSDFQLATGEFSGLVAGVPLWMDIGTTARGCNGPRSEFLVADSEARQVRPADAAPGDLMVCLNPPVDPFATHNGAAFVRE